MMNNASPRTWKLKFAEAFRGMSVGMRGQSSFRVHKLTASAVVLAGLGFRLSTIEWCILLICISMVMAAELFNSALETLSRAVDANDNPHIRDALDISAGAVLAISIGAAAVGLVVFGNALL